MPHTNIKQTKQIPAISTGGIAKRIFDITICFLALPFLIPFFFIIIVIIKLDSPGPAFYFGRRAGLDGKPFKIVKFRTMIVDAEKVGGGTTALQDPRIFRFGGLLRKYKLDELPQVFNVIKGDMSLVGPRPELFQYVDQYKGEELMILKVRPGITDYSSIEFSFLQEIVGSEDADAVFEKRVLTKKNKLRIKYVKERTFFRDIELILKTMFCIARKVFR